MAAAPAATCPFSTWTNALIDLAANVDIVYSPVIDIKEYPENVDVVLVEGAICNEDHVEMIHHVRSNTKVIVAFGDCAVTGNVTAIRNQLGLGNAENVLQRAYIEGADINSANSRASPESSRAAGARHARSRTCAC